MADIHLRLSVVQLSAKRSHNEGAEVWWVKRKKTLWGGVGGAGGRESNLIWKYKSVYTRLHFELTLPLKRTVNTSDEP